MDVISHLSEDINYIYIYFPLLFHELSELCSEFLLFIYFFSVAFVCRAFQIGRFLKYLVIFGSPLSCKSVVQKQKYQRGQDLLTAEQRNFLLMCFQNINRDLFFEANQCHNSLARKG